MRRGACPDNLGDPINAEVDWWNRPVKTCSTRLWGRRGEEEGSIGNGGFCCFCCLCHLMRVVSYVLLYITSHLLPFSPILSRLCNQITDSLATDGRDIFDADAVAGSDGVGTRNEDEDGQIIASLGREYDSRDLKDWTCEGRPRERKQGDERCLW